MSALGALAWQPKGRAPRAVEADLIRLLPAFDTYLMGHRDRDFIARRRHWPKIGPGGGVLHPTITVGGAAVGTWRLRRRADKRHAELLALRELDGRDRAAIDAELDDVDRFEGGPVTRS